MKNRSSFARKSVQGWALLSYIPLLVFAVVVAAPFVWVLASSMRQFNDAVSLPPKWLPPFPPVLHYYAALFASDSPFVGFIANSVKISLVTTLGVTFHSAVAGYAFAKLKFPGRDLIFAVLLVALMIPIQTLIIPFFILMKFLGLVNSQWALFLPGLTGAFVPGMSGAFGIFMMRQFFRTVPKEISEAARIDGAGYFTIFGRIMLPLAKAELVALAIILFSYAWNDYFLPLIFLQSVDQMVLPVGILAIRQPFGTGDPLELAAVVVSIFPLMIIFLLGQRKIVDNFVSTGLKG